MRSQIKVVQQELSWGSEILKLLRADGKLVEEIKNLVTTPLLQNDHSLPHSFYHT